jgi:hypothetical protein
MMGMPPSRCRSAGIRLTTSGHVDTNFGGMTNDSAPAFGVRRSTTGRIRGGALDAPFGGRALLKGNIWLRGLLRLQKFWPFSG